MSVLDSYFNIFNEGADDNKHRQHAVDVYERIFEALGGDLKGKFKQSPGTSNSVTVNIGELIGDKDLENLNLRFVEGSTRAQSDTEKSVGSNFRAKASFKGSVIGGKHSIQLHVPGAGFTQDPIGWKKFVEKNAKSMFKRFENGFFIHEFIHYVDFLRIHPDDIEKKSKAFYKSKKGNKSYYNDPLELNAYIQQGLGRLEHHLRSLTGKHPEGSSGQRVEKLKVRALIGKSPNEFYTKVLSVLPEGFAENLTDANKNKLKKRAAQMWTDTMKRFK